MRRLTLVACLLLGLMAGSTGSASAMIRAKYLAKPSPGATTPQAPAPAPGGDPTAPLPPSNPHALQVVSGEYFLQLSKSTVSAGDVRVEFNNAFAEDPHDLHLVREDGTGSSYAFGELQSGEVEAKTLDLDAGRWTLFCALPEHATRGMRATLRVASG
jgi:plastocyanin